MKDKFLYFMLLQAINGISAVMDLIRQFQDRGIDVVPISELTDAIETSAIDAMKEVQKDIVEEGAE